MTIDFDKIPSSIRKPGKYFEFNAKAAVRTLPGNKQKMLIVAQKLAAGTAAQKTAVQIFSDADAGTYFGRGSLAHLMVSAALKANPYIDLTVIALDDAPAGVAASGTVTVTGPAAASGTLTLFIGNQKVEAAISSGDTASVIAAAIAVQAGKQPDLPVTAVSALGVVTLTAKNKGLCGNQIGLGYQLSYASGVGAAVTAMANGATNPAITDALAIAQPAKFDIIATPYNNQTDIVELRAHLDLVSGPLEQRPGIGVYAMTGPMSDATTLAGQIDGERILCAYLRYTSTQRKSPPYEIAAKFAAVIAGEEDPARPLNTLELTGVPAPDYGERLTRTEQESLLYNGVSPLEIGPGEKVQIVRAISTYTKDAQGIDDPTYLDITTIRTLDYVRLSARTRVALRFPREKLSSRTPAKVRTEILDVLLQLEELEIVENVRDWLPGLVVERSAVDANRLDAKIPADIVNGLHVFAGRIDLIL